MVLGVFPSLHLKIQKSNPELSKPKREPFVLPSERTDIRRSSRSTSEAKRSEEIGVRVVEEAEKGYQGSPG